MRFAFFIDRFRWTKKLHAVLCQSEGRKRMVRFWDLQEENEDGGQADK